MLTLLSTIKMPVAYKPLSSPYKLTAISSPLCLTKNLFHINKLNIRFNSSYLFNKSHLDFPLGCGGIYYQAEYGVDYPYITTNMKGERESHIATKWRPIQGYLEAHCYTKAFLNSMPVYLKSNAERYIYLAETQEKWIEKNIKSTLKEDFNHLKVTSLESTLFKSELLCKKGELIPKDAWQKFYEYGNYSGLFFPLQ